MTELDLESCAREPIHLLGGIQPHGVLVAFRPEDLSIAVASANAASLLGATPEALLGQPLGSVLPDGVLARVRAGSALGPVRVEVQGRACSALLHDSDGLSVLELELLGPEDAAAEADALAALNGLLRPLFGARDSRALLQAAADAVRALIGFDRVMVYRFHPDWHGEVVAESRGGDAVAFMGQHFPASDIPAQARALYTRNPLRLIADVSARPVGLVPPVLPGTQRPLDLSGAALRSVSEVHLEYLRNMGVAASLSVSLLEGGQLWGLIACHHFKPFHVSAARRRACAVLARMLSLQLSAEERSAEAATRASRVLLQGQLVKALGAVPRLTEVIGSNAEALLALTASTGVALMLGEGLGAGEADAILRVGVTPSEEEVRGLAGWLAGRADVMDAFHTERLGEHYPPLAPRADIAAGLLAIRLAERAPRFVLWFRPEVARTVTWAGDPRVHAMSVPGSSRLHPRASFSAWREEVRGASAPWTDLDVEAAESFRGVLVGVVLRHAETLARLSRALARSNAELDAFSGTVSHDLKEPLRGIQQYAGFILEDFGSSMGSQGREHLEALVWLARRSQGLLDSLFEYSRMGRIELAWVPTDMNAVVEEVLLLLSGRLSEGHVEVRLPRRLPAVECDAVRIQQVWANLVSNAAKYQAEGPHWVELGYFGPGEPRPGAAARYDAPYVFYVRDPGIGIPARFHEAVFEMFRRLHPANSYGGGSGAGLAIARRLVELHGGALWLDSAPGEGSTFYFTLGRRPGREGP